MSVVPQHPSDSTATSLICRAQLSDPAAWERLTQLYGPVVYGWARRAGMPPEDASDVMQDVFESLLPNLASFRRRDADDRFRGWLWTVCRNKIRDHFRRQKNFTQAVGGTAAHQALQHVPEVAAAPSDPSSEESQAELSGIRRRALELASGDFPSRTWQAFWRSAIEGDAPADVASDLGISVWAVYKARARVLQKLRKEFAELID